MICLLDKSTCHIESSDCEAILGYHDRVKQVDVRTYNRSRKERVVKSIYSDFEALTFGQRPIAQLSYFKLFSFNDSTCNVGGDFGTASVLLKIKKFQ